ncbi:AAA family ATPase [Paenibacillus sp. Marseille-Q7038]
MNKVDNLDQRRNQLMKPFSELNNFISEIFEDKGIKLTDSIMFGYEENAMLSEKLSAGEQQMLSFLCYNAFLDNSAVFIDEHELSLHVDWQRDLFPILSSQSKNNQFFVATHSPFIYSRYESNEIILSENRGWNYA